MDRLRNLSPYHTIPYRTIPYHTLPHHTRNGEILVSSQVTPLGVAAVANLIALTMQMLEERRILQSHQKEWRTYIRQTLGVMNIPPRPRERVLEYQMYVRSELDWNSTQVLFMNVSEPLEHEPRSG